MMSRYCYVIGLSILVGTLTGCQILPKAQGLPNRMQLEQQQLLSEQQAEILWRDQSFSFLLYQKQQSNYLQVLALSISGQVLFELHYDGKKVQVIQRIPEMKYLPFDFLLRDILWATLPVQQVRQDVEPLGLQVLAQQHDQQDIREIQQQSQTKMQTKTLLRVIHHIHPQQGIQIENFVVPYRMILTPASASFFAE
ncbi:DUF3261 domain-containing protein [Acinetobacter qingfengensis]|uniref:Uncharacterized protein n=1 Tax=Acinetobacter qingfengensis TaxID=1262585 RepID=A0A1E7R2V0_9GAMM|nr:DUF3261 domain-containing protein [Acinetobacter qingfengensis]KAA8733860.1 DUF3261 domain-containing protein [Acinetobacter qingfengensis]OEY93627.1 hypothetical protein BJI46_04075 [Acinetobacter qingfengensis]